MRMTSGGQCYSLLVGTLFIIIIGISFQSNAVAQANQTQTPAPTATKPIWIQAGLYDEKIKELVSKGVTGVRDRVDFSAYGHKYRLLSFDPLQRDDAWIIGGTVLLYQIDTVRPTLIWEQTTDMDMPFPSRAAPVPGDWFNDGIERFSILSDWWNTSWSSQQLAIYSLLSNNTVTPVSMDFISKGYEAGSVEKQDDGTLLLVADDYRDNFVMGLDKWSIYTCCGPYLHRYFQWTDGKFVDVSATYSAKYYPVMGAALQYVTTIKQVGTKDNSDRFYALNLLRLLVIYEDIGERNAGWSLVQTLVTEAKQSGRLPDHTYVDDTFMPWAEKLYRADETFVAPDCRGCGS